MNAVCNGSQTCGRKGQPYDWQSLLVPTEPAFSDELDDLVTRHSQSGQTRDLTFPDFSPNTLTGVGF